MKTHKFLPFVFLTLLIAAACIFCGCSEEKTLKPDDENRSTFITQDGLPDLQSVIDAAEEITPEEIEMLKFVREEEKLARDVYDTLSNLYSVPLFNNIFKSEQVHMDKVLCLLVHFNIEDPASEEIGVFSNPDLQSFYNSLIDLGTPSLIGALTAGATIEDYDIHDLNHNIELTENIAIITIFEYLVCGSGNHMRAFSSLLNMRDVEYTPQFISPEEYSIILESEHQFCGLR